jgi:hypothetical protein
MAAAAFFLSWGDTPVVAHAENSSTQKSNESIASDRQRTMDVLLFMSVSGLIDPFR